MRDGGTPPAVDLDAAATAAQGTPFPVDIGFDRHAVLDVAALLAGPVLGLGHFFAVYLVAEAGCTGDGPGLDVFDPPVPSSFTLLATVLAAGGCLVAAVWTARRARGAARPDPTGGAAGGAAGGDPDDGRGLALVGAVLSVVFLVTVLFVGVTAVALAPCAASRP